MDNKKNLIIEKIEEWTTIFFFCASVFVLIFLTQALLLTWLSQFKTEYILISLSISLIFSIIFLRLIKKDMKLIPHLNLAVVSVIVLVSLILILFPHDSFGGRDEGNYSGQAMILSKYHNILVPPYLLKTPLAYGTIDQNIIFNPTTPSYVVWLATQEVLFGVGWMLRSNVVLIFLGLCSLFLVSSFITKKFLAFMTILFFSTCMPFLWFSRETMTENMAFFLLWFLILSSFLFFKTKKNYFLMGFFLSSWLFSFTRNEGLFIQIPVFIIFITILIIRKIAIPKKILLISTIYVSLIVLSFIANNNLLPLKDNLNIKSSLSNLNIFIEDRNFVRLGDKIPIFTFQMLSKQNLSLALYSFIFVMILIIVSKKSVVKDKILYICLIGIVSVEYLKFINPAASLEQPWMYRRYLYALLPLGYLSLSILLSRLVKQKLLIFIFCNLLIINFVLSNKIITLKNNWYITENIERLTQDISTKDFVIIDGDILGNYSPTTYLAYHKEIRNLYGWWIEMEDWKPKEKKYQGLPYSRLFFLSDNEYADYQGFKLKEIKEIEIESNQLQVNCELRSFGRELELNIGDPARLPYLDVLNYCRKTDNDIGTINKKVFLYEMDYNNIQ